MLYERSPNISHNTHSTSGDYPRDRCWRLGCLPDFKTPAQYIDSLHRRNIKVYLFDERVAEPADHPMLAHPSMQWLRQMSWRMTNDEQYLGNRSIIFHRWSDKLVFTYPRKHCGFGKQGPYTGKIEPKHWHLFSELCRLLCHQHIEFHHAQIR